MEKYRYGDEKARVVSGGEWYPANLEIDHETLWRRSVDEKAQQEYLTAENDARQI